MECLDCREAISARLDGEGPAAEAAAIDAHIERCPACRRYRDQAARVTRLTRTRAAEPGPDLVAFVVAAAPRRRTRPAATSAVRAALAVVGIGQLVLATAGIVSAAGHVTGDGMRLEGASAAHLAHESSAWNLALAVGFLVTAAGVSRVAGLVPVIGAFVASLAVLSALDVLGGRVDPSRLATHGLAVIGLALLVLLRRQSRRGGGGAATAPAPAVGADPGDPRFGGRREWDRPEDLRPTARRRVA